MSTNMEEKESGDSRPFDPPRVDATLWDGNEVVYHSGDSESEWIMTSISSLANLEDWR